MRSIVPFLALLLFCQVIFTQTPKPSATPLRSDDTVKISTALIQIDVSVTDKKGRIVTGLSPEDFEIFENDTKQKITSFSFISSVPDPVADQNLKAEEFEIPPPPAAELKPSEIRRTIAIVVDDLSFSFESVNYVKRALKSFVKNQMQYGDLVAIVRASGGIGSLQQFTTNKSYLYESIDKIRWKKNRGGGQIGVFKPFSVGSGELDTKGYDTDSPDRDIVNAEGTIDAFRKDVFVSGTLGAMQYVIDGIKPLPGRKSMLLMSDGFEIFNRGQNGLTESTSIVEKLDNLIESANEAAVVIYSIDTRGLQTLNFTAADDLGSRPIQNRVPVAGTIATTAITQDKTEALARDRRNTFAAMQDGLNYLAKETGGLFVRNTNDIYGGIKTMLNDQSYYLLAYEPDSDNFDPEKDRFNKLDIRVKRDDVKVRYRSGFFGTSGEQTNSLAANSPANERLNNALISPFPVSDININLSSLFQGNEKSKLFINSLLYIDVSDLIFSDSANGRKKAVFDLLAANVDENGVPTDQLNKTFTMEITADVYERMKKEGFIYYFTLPIKEAGAYQMRVAIRDKASDKIGSTNQIIGVPKLKNKELALSGIALDNIPYNKWNTGFGSQYSQIATTKTAFEEDLPTTTDTAIRKFNRGTVLRYALELYNARRKKKDKSNLFFRTRVFHNNRVIHEGKDTFIDVSDVSKTGLKPIAGAINIGTVIPTGGYVLQIIVTEQLDQKNRQVATQFIQFEVVEGEEE
ncbi:MAG: VWA domain-containing protein [Pyrinomonadaceae bacterium]